MPRNGSGQFSAITNSWNPAINGLPATAADWQAVLNDIVSALTQSVSRDGQTAMTGNLPMAGNKVTGLGNATATGDALTFAQLFSQGQQQDVPAAATTDIGAQLSTLINVTGAATITSFGTNYNGPRFLRFAGVCTLTNSASLVLPGGANITTAAGDSLIAVPLGNPATGWRVVASSGSSLVGYLPSGTGAVATNVQSKLREFVSVMDFGVDTTGVVDSTTALTNALTAATDLLLEGTIRVTSPITLTKTNLRIHARPGASIVYAGSTGSTSVLRFNAVNSLIIDGQLTIDCDAKAGVGLAVRGINGAALVDISGVTVIDCTHSSPSTEGATGIQVLCNSGTGKIAKVTHCVVSNVTRTTANGAGASCSGIGVYDFDVMVVENNDINSVLKGNGTIDADGISVFTQLSGSTYSKASVSIRNNRVRNCEGRFVKTQTRGQCSIEDNYFAIDSAIALVTGFRAVDAQISDTTIQNNTVELLASWTGGSEMTLFNAQFNATPDFAGQKIEHKVLNNSVFCASGVPTFAHLCFVDLTSMGTNAVTAFAHVEGNVAVGAGGWEGASLGALGIAVRPPETAFAAGATANVLIANNRVNTTEFMERFANGANAAGAFDFRGDLFLTVVGNYLPQQRGDIAVLPHDTNNSFTSSFCVYGNSVGSRGNRVAMPFNFAHILGGNNFLVAGESSPARTNAPASYTFGVVERVGNTLWTNNRAYRYSSLSNIGATPSWAIYNTRVVDAWAVGTFSTSRTVPNSATATTTQLADALNTLVNDMKNNGMVA